MDDWNHHFPRGTGAGSSLEGGSTNPTTTTTTNKKKQRWGTDDATATAVTKGNKSASTTDDILFGKNDDDATTKKEKKQKQNIKITKDLHGSNKRQKTTSSVINSTGTSNSKSLLPIGGGGCTATGSGSNNTMSKIEYINADTLVPGCQLLGIVQSILTVKNNTDDSNDNSSRNSSHRLHGNYSKYNNNNNEATTIVTFSLPNGWMGYMIIHSSSSSSSSLQSSSSPTLQLVQYQIVPVIIQQIKQEIKAQGKVRRRIIVSCYPQHINLSLSHLYATINMAVSSSSASSGIDTKKENSNISTTTTTTTTATNRIKLFGIIVSLEDYGMVIDIGYNGTSANNKNKMIKGFLLYTDIDWAYEIIHQDEQSTTTTTARTANTANATQQQTQVLQLKLHRLVECMVKTNVDVNTITNMGIVPLCIPKNIYQQPLTFPTTGIQQQVSTLPTEILFRPGTLLQNVIVETTMQNGLAICFGPNSIFRASIDISHIPGLHHLHPSTTTTTTTTTTITTNSDKDNSWHDYYLIHHRILPLVRIIAYEVKTKVLRCSLLPHLLYYQNHMMMTKTTTNNNNNNSNRTSSVIQYNHLLLNIMEEPKSSTSLTTMLPKSLDTTSLSAVVETSTTMMTIPTIGTIVSNCTVVRIDPGIGIVLALPEQYNKKDDDDGDNKLRLGDCYDSKTKKEKKKEITKMEKDHIEACKVRYVYVPISKAIDDDNDDEKNGKSSSSSSSLSKIKTRDNTLLMKQYRLHSQHTVRILSNGYNDSDYLMEYMMIGATTSKYIKAHVLSHYDLIVGQVYKQVPILSHIQSSSSSSSNNKNETSIMIDFGLGVHGLIPAIHLLDTTSEKNNDRDMYRTQSSSILDRKYKVGMKIDVRVLSVDRVNKRCICTCKKSLVKALPQQMITSYNDVSLQMGNVVYGYVSKIDMKHGIYITFCNNVYGRVPMKSIYNELGLSSMEEIQSIYHRGTVVLCRIVHIKEQVIGRKKNSLWNHQQQQQHDDDNDEIEIDEDNDEVNSSHSSPHYKDRSAFREITLSLRIDDGEDVEGKESISTSDNVDGVNDDTTIKQNSNTSTVVSLSAGTLLPLNSIRVVELHPSRITKRVSTTNSLNGTTFVPGFAIVSVKSKYILPQKQKHLEKILPQLIECKLPYDQLMDIYSQPDCVPTAETMDSLAEQTLSIGKKINRKGILLQDPKKASIEYINGTGPLIILSIRPQIIRLVEHRQKNGPKDGEKDQIESTKPTELEIEDPDDKSEDMFLPNPYSHFYVGAIVMGYVVSLDVRHGAFVRFLDGMTGLVPKTKHGLQLQLYNTVIVKVLAVDDKLSPPKILLGLTKHNTDIDLGNDEGIPKMILKHHPERPPLNPGDAISGAIISKLDFHRATVDILDDHLAGLEASTKVQLHVTMVHHKVKNKLSRKTKPSIDTADSTAQMITAHHPFFHWKVGDELSNLHVLSVELRGKFWIVELTNRSDIECTTYIQMMEQLNPGDKVSGIVSGISKHKGLWMELSPTVSAHIPALELSTDVKVLNSMDKHYPTGSRLDCVVLDKSNWELQRKKYCKVQKKKLQGDDMKTDIPFLSLLRYKEATTGTIQKPEQGALIVGRIDRSLPSLAAPDLMIDLRGGYIGRCCITEICEPDDWTNFPLGRVRTSKSHTAGEKIDEKPDVDVGTDDNEGIENAQKLPNDDNPFTHGTYVQCRVLTVNGTPSKPFVEVSLRQSRLEGDLEDDASPEVGDSVQAYVVETSKKGCFLRMSRHVEGRTILKELCDGFLPNPSASFPVGRLVVGRVKDIRKVRQADGVTIIQADVDMRESVLVDEEQGKLKFEDLEIGVKYRASVTRIEEYGVFVRLENSDVSGLVHKSECSDKFVKNLADMYDPGDLVKVVLLKKDLEKKQVGFGMKASYFVNDADSEDDEESEDHAEDGVEDDSLMLVDDATASDDENYVAKLSAKMNSENYLDEDTESSASEDETDDDEGTDEEEGKYDGEVEDDGDDNIPTLDTNVGFDWSGGLTKVQASNEVSDNDSSDNSDIDDDEHGDSKPKSSKARQKQRLRQQEEKEISRRETALADGTVDENPESAADFERMLAGEPNSSELWIRYMAFYLTTANIPAARSVANRAFERIEFRQEKEKLNVWCALLTLELKYGTEASLQAEMDRACQQNNPKHVHLRVCEIMVKHQMSNPSPSLLNKTDATFAKMCSKFRSKKTVWISHFSYLLEQSRYEEAQKVIQRALLSLPTYKHVETLSKYAILAFAHGRVTAARTVFDGLLKQHPKRLDLLFVYADQEIKNGHFDVVRSMFQLVSTRGNLNASGTKTSALNNEILTSMKFNDKQMKRLFKKWYTFEEAHGTDATRESVKDAARAYVENSLK